LRSLSEHYARWRQLYTLTDAERDHGNSRSQNIGCCPFVDFELMVQTTAKERSVEANNVVELPT
jgi:hypothetical protein